MIPDEKYSAYGNIEQGTEYRILTVGTCSAHGLQYLSEHFSWLQIRLILEFWDVILRGYLPSSNHGLYQNPAVSAVSSDIYLFTFNIVL